MMGRWAKIRALYVICIEKRVVYERGEGAKCPMFWCRDVPEASGIVAHTTDGEVKYCKCPVCGHNFKAICPPDPNRKKRKPPKK